MNTSHEKSNDGKDEWLTPPYIIESLGEFDLDPCSPVNRPWPTAKKHYTINDMGQMLDWEGRVWLNPPYGDQTGIWLGKLKMHGDGIALVFNRSGTKWFHEYVLGVADGLFLFKGRLKFYNVDGTPADGKAGADSVLIAYGEHNLEAIRNSGLQGHLIVNP